MAYKCQSARALWRVGVGESGKERLLGHRSPLHPLWFPFVLFHSKGCSVYGCACWPGTYGHSKSISIGSIPIQRSCRLYGCKEDAKPGRVSLWLCVPSRIHGPWGERTPMERALGPRGELEARALGFATNETQPWPFFKFFTLSLPAVGSGSRVPFNCELSLHLLP